MSPKLAASVVTAVCWSSSAKCVERAPSSARRSPETMLAACEAAAIEVAFSRAAMVLAISSRAVSSTKLMMPCAAGFSDALQ
jgi:hypothetical protein